MRSTWISAASARTLKSPGSEVRISSPSAARHTTVAFNRIPLAATGQQQPRPAPQRVIDHCDIGPGEQPGDWHLTATATTDPAG